MVTKPWSDSNGDSASKSHGDDVELIIDVVIMCSDKVVAIVSQEGEQAKRYTGA